MSFDSINIKQYSLIMKWLLYQLLGSYFRAPSCFTFTPPMACRNMNHSGMWTSNSQWARLKLCFTYSYCYCQHIGRWKQLGALVACRATLHALNYTRFWSARRLQRKVSERAMMDAAPYNMWRVTGTGRTALVTLRYVIYLYLKFAENSFLTNVKKFKLMDFYCFETFSEI